jgi:SAM-dependent methyltransferase
MYPSTDRIIDFTGSTDAFYEGAYERQIHFIPDGCRLRNIAFFGLVQSGVLGVLKQELERCRERAVVVDVGCAGGIRWLASNADVIGVDVSISALEHATEHYPLGLRTSGFHLPLQNAAIDIVYGSYVYEHVPPTAKDQFLGEIARVLRPGGSCVLQFDTHADNRLMRWARRDEEAYRRGFVEHDGHVGLETLSQAIRRIDEAGLEIVTAHPFGWTPVQYLPLYSWLDIAYGDKHRWVRVVSRISRWASRNRVGTAYEFAVTMLYQRLQRWAPRNAGTNAIVIARKPTATTAGADATCSSATDPAPSLVVAHDTVPQQPSPTTRTPSDPCR